MTPNLPSPNFERRWDASGFQGVRRARVGREAGSQHLGASVWEIPPGQGAYPYHYHLAEEEQIVVLAGRPSLRTPEGWRELDEGETVAFPVGERFAHQLANRTSEPVRFLSLSTVGDPDVCVYPDSGKVAIRDSRATTPDGGRLPGGKDRVILRLADVVDYWEGEGPPEMDS